IRESGRIFAAPTYFFITSILTVIGIGAWRYATGTLPSESAVHAAMPGELGAIGAFMLLTAFSNGCTAMTGVEAVSNGVPAFRPPGSREAAATLAALAARAIVTFTGSTLL